MLPLHCLDTLAHGIPANRQCNERKKNNFVQINVDYLIRTQIYCIPIKTKMQFIDWIGHDNTSNPYKSKWMNCNRKEMDEIGQAIVSIEWISPMLC